MQRIGIMHVTDSLAAGGTERVAVNLANRMPRDRYRVYLCTTRVEGPLSSLVADDVGRLQLRRRHRFDLAAIQRLIRFIRDEDIRILHAHSSSLLVANLARLSSPFPAVIWHDHFGRYAVENRPEWLFRMLTRRIAGVVAVNQPLASWSRGRLGVQSDRVWYLPNFACDNPAQQLETELPGSQGRRIVCVANLRPEKDHLTLLDAMALVLQQVPDAHLLLVGGSENQEHFRRVQQAARRPELAGKVSLLGPRRDVSAILRFCDIGVLSSASEGLPLSLLEYGLGGLAVSATDVGQCGEVLDQGRCGELVPCRDPARLADALVGLLLSNQRRARLAAAFQRRVHEHYSAEAAIHLLDSIYHFVLSGNTIAATAKVSR